MGAGRIAVSRAAGRCVDGARDPIVAGCRTSRLGIARLPLFHRTVTAARRTIVVVVGIAALRTTIVVISALSDGLMGAGRGAVSRATSYGINCARVSIVAAS